MKQAESQIKPRRAYNKQTTFKLTTELRDDFISLAREEYGLRGVAHWVEDSLRDFVQIPDFALRVGAGEAKIALSTAKTITLTPAAERLLNEAVTKVRRIDPTAESVRAQVLRASLSHYVRKKRSQEPAALEIAAEKPRLRRGGALSKGGQGK